MIVANNKLKLVQIIVQTMEIVIHKLESVHVMQISMEMTVLNNNSKQMESLSTVCIF